MISQPLIARAAIAFEEYDRQHGVEADLDLFVDGGLYGDRDLAHCRKRAEASANADGVALCDLFLKLEPHARDAIYFEHRGYPEYDEAEDGEDIDAQAIETLLVAAITAGHTGFTFRAPDKRNTLTIVTGSGRSDLDLAAMTNRAVEWMEARIGGAE